jgi:hypothetical protein
MDNNLVRVFCSSLTHWRLTSSLLSVGPTRGDSEASQMDRAGSGPPMHIGEKWWRDGGVEMAYHKRTTAEQNTAADYQRSRDTFSQDTKWTIIGYLRLCFLVMAMASGGGDQYDAIYSVFLSFSPLLFSVLYYSIFANRYAFSNYFSTSGLCLFRT